MHDDIRADQCLSYDNILVHAEKPEQFIKLVTEFAVDKQA